MTGQLFLQLVSQSRFAVVTKVARLATFLLQSPLHEVEPTSTSTKKLRDMFILGHVTTKLRDKLQEKLPAAQSLE